MTGSVDAMQLVWAVPVVSAALAMVVLALAARPLSDEAAGLAADVRRLRELRRPLAGVRTVLDETGDVASGAGPRPVPDSIAADERGDLRADGVTGGSPNGSHPAG